MNKKNINNINTSGQQCNNCNIAQTIARATQQQIPCHHPIQMKPADTENRNERKLFVGMLSKTMNEQDVRNMFSTFGVIEECSILRDNNGQSKGCAFVTYSSRTSASNAIKSLNHSTTMEGCTSSLVVKFADTQKDKEQRKGKQSLMQQLWTQTTSPLSASLVTNPYLTLAALTTAAQQQQLATTLALQQQYLNSDISLATALASNPVLMAAALTGSPHTKASPQSTPITVNQLYNANKLDLMAGVRDQLSFTSSLSSTPTLSGVQQLGSSISTSASANASKQIEGPEGANLFIYHLPPEFTDADLITSFSPFGNVISAKVFIDKNSNLSKCFGKKSIAISYFFY
jgi:CUG-BP- and ETR3-like factor